jgi:hypothetical protein
MARESDGRPEVLGLKIDECTTCHRVDVHLLTEFVERQGAFTRTMDHRLVCTRCGASASIDGKRAVSAAKDGRLIVERRRPNIGAVLAEGPRAAPGDRSPASPYSGGEPTTFVSRRLAHARLALAGGANRMTVERKIVDEFLPNPEAKRASRYRIVPIAVSVITVLVVVAAAALFLRVSPDDQSSSTASGTTAGAAATPTPLPTPRPTATSRPTPTPITVPSLLPDDLLAAYVQPLFVAECQELSRNLPDKAIVGLRCRTPDDPITTADYYLFDALADLNRAFSEIRDAADITTVGIACFEGGQGQYSRYYTDSDAPVGDITCFRDGRVRQVVWTHWGDLIMARAYRDSGTVKDVADKWMSGALGPCDGPCSP